MNRIIIFLILSALFAACKKNAENIVWEKSYGSGTAVFVRATGDTGFVSCGETGGKPYLLFIDKNGNKVFEYKSESQGIMTSVWTGDGYFITTGSEGGKMMISKIDFSGTVLWDTLLNSSFTIENSALCYLGGDNFISAGSANPDSAYKTSTGLSYVWFDVSGNITQKKDSLYSSYVAVKSVAADNSGNIYLALTRGSSGGKMKAEVSKYNSDFQKLWEKELYNNPSYSAASLNIMVDAEGNPLVVGRTELPVPTGKENNAFVARYFFTGDSIQKKYLEYANAASSVISDGTGQFIVLNMRCMIVNIMDQNIKVSGIIRTYNSCDSKTTDAFGYSLDLTDDGNIIIAGSKGGGYYLAVKSQNALSPV